MSAMIQAVPAQAIPLEEPAILERARQLMARLPVDACDLLIVDQMGKEISGGGMDNNIIGRMFIDGEPEPPAPRIGMLAALRLTRATHGNACGIGYADLITQQLIDAMDEEITRINIATSGFLLRGRVPPVVRRTTARPSSMRWRLLSERTQRHGATSAAHPRYAQPGRAAGQRELAARATGAPRHRAGGRAERDAF